jgi:Fe-S-cluster-containing dehydrogenase component
MCSYENNEFNPTKSKIKIIHIDEHGTYIPILDCNHECLEGSKKEIPNCVQFCNTGSLIYETSEDAADMKADLIRSRKIQPIFKVIAPWKWPFPWKPWPFEGEENK